MTSPLTSKLENGSELLFHSLSPFNPFSDLHLPLQGSRSVAKSPTVPDCLQSIQIPNNSLTPYGNYAIETLLQQLNSSDLDLDALSNITREFLKTSLFWQPLNVVQQPEYIVMILLCFLALLTNIVSIIATCHIRGSRTMHLKLIINLAVSDILIVFSILLLIIHKIFNMPLSIGVTRPEDRLLKACFLASVNSVNIMSLLMALFNFFAMALNHFIAIKMPLRYTHLMSKKRGYLFISLLWIIATVGGLSNLFVGFIGYKRHELFNFCEYIMYDQYQGEMLIFAVTIICLFTIVVIYTMVFFEVKKIQARLVTKYPIHNHKAIITSLVIVGSFTIGWLPNCIFQIIMISQIQFNKEIAYKLISKFLLITKYLQILQLVNCTVDPIIYAVRLKVVQTGYRNCLAHIRHSYKSMRSSIRQRNHIKSLKAGYRPPFFKQGCDIELCDIDVDKKVCSKNKPDLNTDSQFNSGLIYKLSDESNFNNTDHSTKVLIQPSSSENLATGYEEIAL